MNVYRPSWEKIQALRKEADTDRTKIAAIDKQIDLLQEEDADDPNLWEEGVITRYTGLEDYDGRVPKPGHSFVIEFGSGGTCLTFFADDYRKFFGRRKPAQVVGRRCRVYSPGIGGYVRFKELLP